jgi:hypothetical protein
VCWWLSRCWRAPHNFGQNCRGRSEVLGLTLRNFLAPFQRLPDDFVFVRAGELLQKSLATFPINERGERTALRTAPGVQLDRKVPLSQSSVASAMVICPYWGRCGINMAVTFLDLAKHLSVSARSGIDLHRSEVLSFVPTPSLAKPALQKFSVKSREISAINSESPALRLKCAHKLACIDRGDWCSQFRRLLFPPAENTRQVDYNFYKIRPFET